MAMVFRKTVSIFIVMIFISMHFVGFAEGDGCLVGKSYTFLYIDQDSQFGVINYVDGVQKMIISVNFEWEESSSTAWIFPIPSDPENINADIADGAPIFSGVDVIEEARDSIERFQTTFLTSYVVSWVCPWPLVSMYFMVLGLAPDAAGVTVHKHLEKYGLVVEVISATEGSDVYDYLNDNDLDISEGMISQLENYIGENYSFVVAWMGDTGISARRPGVIVEFPTDEMFYPLVLTSVYEDTVIPMEIMIRGHVSPRIYGEIEPYTSVTYLRGDVTTYSEKPVSREVGNFVNEIKGGWDGSFTVVNLSAPSSTFTKDLWISNKVPAIVEHAKSVEKYYGRGGILTLVLITLVVSPLLSVGFGAAILGRKREAIPYYFALGWANLLGVYGVLLATLITRKQFCFSAKRALLFVLLFFLSFVGLVLAILLIASALLH